MRGMPRRLDVIHGLLREPCPVDPSALPRVEGGFGCADCGRTVVDVARLTLEELTELRRRARSGTERICGAYTLDREDRVLLRATSNSSTMIAVAVSVLLAACDTGMAEGTTRAPHSETVALRSSVVTPIPTLAPPPPPSAKAETAAPELAVPRILNEAQSAKLPAPACIPGSKGGGQGHAAHPPNDTRMLAGY